ncbi:MAG: hypothetical protein C4342_01220 [Armatimonadota bacterium]
MACLFAWLLYRATRPTLADDAAGAFRAEILHPDPERLYDYIFEFQKEQANLSRDKYVRMWRSLVEPRLSKFRLVANDKPVVEAGGEQGIVGWRIQDSRGNTLSLFTVVDLTDFGGRLHAFDSLRLAWVLEYSISEGKALSDTGATIAAWLKGLRQDRNTLESLGITKWPRTYPWQRPLSFDEVERNLQENLRKSATLKETP